MPIVSVPYAGRLGNDVIVLCASDIRLISSRCSENTTYLSIFFQRNTRTQKRSHSCPFPNTNKGSKPRLSYIFIHTSYSTIQSSTPHAPPQQTVRTQCSKIPRPGHTLGKTLNPSNCESECSCDPSHALYAGTKSGSPEGVLDLGCWVWGKRIDESPYLYSMHEFCCCCCCCCSGKVEVR